ncbi:MAG: hypothetical protein JNL38_11855 [Myxococcales bacterium]|jgi:Tfp pilus assembly protein PilF|nr:hypothetical protein [Myxococcales bacterium]
MAAALVATVAFGGVACSGKGANAPTGQGAERQSEAEYDVARDLFYKGETRSALDRALKAVELNEENAEAAYFASTIYLSFCAGERGLDAPDCRLGEAERLAKKALKAKSEFRDGKNLLGQIYILQNRPKDAVSVLEPLTRDAAYTHSYLAWGNLGWAQVQAGEVDQGIVSLKNAVTQPRFCVGHYRLGVAYEKKQSFELAEKSFSDALSVDSPDCQALQDAWQGRARVRVRLGKKDDARKDYEKCVSLSKATQAGRACANALTEIPGEKS